MCASPLKLNTSNALVNTHLFPGKKESITISVIQILGITDHITETMHYSNLT